MTAEREIPVLVIFGATASGKTALAGSLFAADGPGSPADPAFPLFHGRCEVISADSMQVYRGMDIGTAKPDPSLLRHLPHHLLDIRNPGEQFCAGDFVRLADEACTEIHARGKLPVVLGGTAFYIRNFIYGLPETPESDPVLRDRLKTRMKEEGPALLHAELASADPESARRIHPNDEYRIIRALEVFASSGRTRSSCPVPTEPRPGYRFLVISLDRSREELYSRINRRVDAMFASGLAGEFESLLAAGRTASDPGMQAIGYREFFLSDPPGSDIPQIRDAVCADSRKYAKRQETFIRAMDGVIHLAADDFAGVYRALAAFYGVLLDGPEISVHNQ